MSGYQTQARAIASRVVPTTSYMLTVGMSHKPLGRATLTIEGHLAVTLPVWCACGKLVTFSGETRCEDCYADDQKRFDGKTKRVKTPFYSAREEADHARRLGEIKVAFLGGTPDVLATQRPR